jgi:hypothetical protein
MDRRDLLAGLATIGVASIAGRGNAMEQTGVTGVLFIAGFGPIVGDSGASLKLDREALGISFKEETGGYLHTGDLKGAKEFALWPLSQAAQSCFGRPFSGIGPSVSEELLSGQDRHPDRLPQEHCSKKKLGKKKRCYAGCCFLRGIAARRHLRRDPSWSPDRELRCP